MEGREGGKNKLPIWAKILIAAAAVAALFLAVFLLRDVPPFNQYRLFLSRTVNSAVNDKERTEKVEGRVVEEDDFAEMDKDIPFKVTRPQWMPEGFELEHADYNELDGNYYIAYRYESKENDEEFVEFNLWESLPIDPQGFTVNFQELIINDIKVYILDIGEDGINVEYINAQGLMVMITSTINQETLIKIIENMS